jgi:galactose mutarotase-like enzyme
LFQKKEIADMEYMENEFLKVGVSAHGAELSQIYDKEKKHDVVWSADPAYWNRHAPVLFPFVGKVTGGEYRYKGQSYPMGQHGFARDREFRLVNKTADSITFVLESDEKTKKVYPFDFTLEITHRLNGRCVRVEWNVVNGSDTEPMYFSIGGHPAFNCPADAGVQKTDYYIAFEGAGDLDYVLIDPEAQAVDDQHVHRLHTEDGYVKVDEALFENDALIFDHAQVQKASLCYPDHTPYVTLNCNSFPSFGLWSKPNAKAPYICLEPWIGRCDNRDFHGELPEKFEEQKLNAGGTFCAAYEIEVH